MSNLCGRYGGAIEVFEMVAAGRLRADDAADLLMYERRLDSLCRPWWYRAVGFALETLFGIDICGVPLN